MKEWFLEHIYGEYQAYRADTLSLTNAEIFGKCYEIDAMINIYEILRGKAEKLPEEALAALLAHGNILRELYDGWLKKDGSSYEELEDHVAEEVDKLAAWKGEGDG